MDPSSPVVTPPWDIIIASVLVPGLRTLRLERALSQESLAERAGVGRKTIMRGERGEHIRLSSVRRLAEALHVNPKRLQVPPRGQ